MALKRVKSGWQVFAYDPSVKRKVYVGTRTKHTDAKQLERDTINALKRPVGSQLRGATTVREYAQDWLKLHHGNDTRRPSPTTWQVNAMNLRAFLADFGDRPMQDGIGRKEALAWARAQNYRAKSVSAMFNDAIDDEVCTSNPFANRRHKQSDERKHIHPLTEDEVDRLAAFALERWGDYGRVAKAWVLFSAWVGTRPGETFRVRWHDLDLTAGLVEVTRIKGRKQTDVIVVAEKARDAIHDMPRLHPEFVFPSVHGREMSHAGGHRFYWDQIRTAFRMTVTPERWTDLLGGQDDLDLYTCRHFCASIIVARGGNEYDVAAQLGNTPEVARESYVHDYRDRTRERIRSLLDRPQLVDLTAERDRRLGGSNG